MSMKFAPVGDEMNMHSGVSLQTVVELKYLAAVSKMIISPSENKPIIAPAQDNLVGLFKITDDGTVDGETKVVGTVYNYSSGVVKVKNITAGFGNLSYDDDGNPLTVDLQIKFDNCVLQY